LERDAVEELLPRGQLGEIDAGREVAGGQRCRAYHALEIGERLRGGILDDRPTGTVCAAPDDRGVTGHIAAGDAIGDGRTRRLGCDEGWGGPLRQEAVHLRAGGKGTRSRYGESREKGTTAHKRLCLHGISFDERLSRDHVSEGLFGMKLPSPHDV
jgi:hypothetical protein